MVDFFTGRREVRHMVIEGEVGRPSQDVMLFCDIHRVIGCEWWVAYQPCNLFSQVLLRSSISLQAL